jgi:hypothetical protein
MHMRRQLYNAGDVPVTRYLIRIAVDRHQIAMERVRCSTPRLA